MGQLSKWVTTDCLTQADPMGHPTDWQLCSSLAYVRCSLRYWYWQWLSFSHVLFGLLRSDILLIDVVWLVHRAPIFIPYTSLPCGICIWIAPFFFFEVDRTCELNDWSLYTFTVAALTLTLLYLTSVEFAFTRFWIPRQMKPPAIYVHIIDSVPLPLLTH